MSDADVITMLKKTGLYDAMAAQAAAGGGTTEQVDKTATVSDVHVSAALGDKKKPLPLAGAKLFTDEQPKDNENADGSAKTDKAFSFDLAVTKMAPDQRMIFGWASVSQIGDVEVIDKQGDIVPIVELEKAGYDFVLTSRAMGDMHTTIGTGRLVESMVFTPDKAKLGIVAKNQDGQQVYGWWTGFFVDSDQVWAAHKRGERPEFSIGGRARSEAA